MSPTRKQQVGPYLIEEFYWARQFVVYVNHYRVREDFEQAIAKYSRAELRKA